MFKLAKLWVQIFIEERKTRRLAKDMSKAEARLQSALEARRSR